MMKTLEPPMDSHQIRLRTVNKDRPKHRASNPESPPQKNSETELPLITDRRRAQIPISRLNTINYNDRSVESRTSEKSNLSADKNCQFSAKFINKLDELDRKAEELIEKRLQKILNEQSKNRKRSSPMMMRRDDEYEPEFEKLIKQIKELKDDELDNYDSRELEKLMAKKINLLEKLMAQKSIEAQVIKKYYFSFGALSRKRQPKNRIAHLLTKLQNIHNPTTSQHSQSQVCNESWNKNSFKAPKDNQYQTYRYVAPKFIANPQPLPRSCYKAQYLTYGTEDQKMYCKNMDSHAFFGNRRKGESGSTYSRDYRSLKTEPIDYKQLDSYRDKIKSIQVSYMFKKNNKDEQTIKSLQEQQILQRMLYTRRPQNRISQQKLQTIKQSSKKLSRSPVLGVTTQTKSNYRGYSNQMASGIKDKQLTSLKYLYKNLVHS